MATLCQARLSLLSQRCLLMAAARRDNVHDSEPSKYDHRCNVTDINLYHISPMNSVSEQTKYPEDVVTRRRTRWRLAILNSNKYSGSIVDNRLLINTTNTYQSINSHDAHVDIDIAPHSKRMFNNNNNNNNDNCTCKKFLSEDPHYHRYHYHKYNHNHHRDDYRQKKLSNEPSISLFAALGLVGIFKSKTSDSIEEDRDKLSDSEKIKKMKPVEILIAKGVLAMCDQNYESANEFFHKALHIAQDEEEEEKENQILNLLAANFFESGDLENAEKLFVDLMKRMIDNGMEATAPPILELSLKLASIYSRDTASHQKALKGFKFVINSLLMNLEDVLSQEGDLNVDELSEEKRDELALLGWSYDWFAKHLLSANDYNGAADMLQRALKISSQVLGPLHDQTLILLNDVGTTLAMQGSPEEGRRFIKKAVECAIESQSKELASFYVNLGLVNLKLLKLSEAKRYCEYSMEIASKNREHYNSHEVMELSRSCLNEVERLLEAEDK